ncbi:GNAT family N-acetyltransferase [Bdellovibrionota bacterium FG-2]
MKKSLTGVSIKACVFLFLMIKIAHIKHQPAALIIAQIESTTGWSRITYMGIMPEFRGQGLGKWVHRKGFNMMRKQGGTLYHGGTVVSNKGMIRLFQNHGCKEYRRMQEWVFKV